MTASTPDTAERIRRSGLVAEDRLAEALTALPPGGDLLAGLTAAGLLTRYQAGQLARGRWRGFLLGTHYRLLEPLGQGGMGAVFLAEHTALNRRVAVKVMAAEHAADPVMVARFVREAQAATALTHPNVVRVLDVAPAARPPYLVMEYVDGVTLQDAVRRAGRFDPGTAAHVGVQVLAGLQLAHERRLVHRDIKPANLMVDRRGGVKLLDLGIVRMHTEATLTEHAAGGKALLGTADYLAPEQIADSSKVDTRADIYALGGTLFALLAGRPPFDRGQSVALKLAQKQFGEAPDVRRQRPDVPDGLATALGVMLARDPRSRYRTPAEAAEALAAFAVPAGDFPARLFDPTRPRAVAIPDPADDGPPTVANRKGGRPPAAVAVAPRRERPAWLPAALAGGGLAVSLLLAAVAWRVVAAPPPPLPTGAAPAVDRAVVRVSKAGGPGTVPTVARALGVVAAGGRVEIADPAWDEPLDVPPGARLPAGVTVCGAAPGGPVVWTAGGEGGAVVTVRADARGLTFAGLAFDGRGRVKDGLGFAAGRAAVRDCTVRGFTGAGVWADGAAELAVAGCRFEAGDGGRYGVYLGTHRLDRAAVSDCRFDGAFRAAVRADGPAGDLRVERNRVAGAEAGVVLAAPAVAAGELAVERNVFAGRGPKPGGVGLGLGGPVAAGCRLSVRGNVFHRLGRAGAFSHDGAERERLIAAGPGPLAAADNLATAADTGCDFHCLNKPVVPLELAAEAADDAHFLRVDPAALPPELRGKVGVARP